MEYGWDGVESADVNFCGCDKSEGVDMHVEDALPVNG